MLTCAVLAFMAAASAIHCHNEAANRSMLGLPEKCHND